MTKRELLTLLQQVPDDAVVMGADDEEGDVFFLEGVEVSPCCDPEAAPTVWLKMEIALDEN